MGVSPIQNKLVKIFSINTPLLFALGVIFVIPGLSPLLLIVYFLFYFDLKCSKIRHQHSLFLSLYILLLLIPILILTNYCSSLLFEDFKKQDIVYSVQNNLNFLKILLLIFISPLIEELYFRRILLNRLIFLIGPFWAIIITSIYFTIIHFNILASPNFFIFSIILGVIYMTTKSLIQCIILHSTFNTVMLLFIV